MEPNLALLQEVGRKLSKKNVEEVKKALAVLTDLLNSTSVSEADINEALSYSETECQLRSSLQADEGFTTYQDGYVYLIDTYADYVVYSVENYTTTPASSKLYKRAYYTMNDEVTLSDTKQEVERKVTYEPTTNVNEAELNNQPPVQSSSLELVESAAQGDHILLAESTISDDNTIKVKLIQPGWGSSGFYPADVLERDGSKVFPLGTKMFWNHQTEREAKERPEGSLNDLAAVLMEDAQYLEHETEGPGLYATAKVTGRYRDSIGDLAPHIGTSIRASGTFIPGVVDGKEGRIIQSLDVGRSVDFVTTAGAGGKILEMFEAAGREPVDIEEKDIQVDEVAERELRESLDASKNVITQLQEALGREKTARVHGDVARTISNELNKADNLPAPSKSRLAESLVNRAIYTEDGELDTVKFTETIRTAIEAETAYIREAAVAMNPNIGKIYGMGSSQSTQQQESSKILEDELTSAMGRIGGLSESAAKVAARGV